MERDIIDFFNVQLQTWDLASANYSKLKDVLKKPVNLGFIEGIVQYNPGRAVSTLAKVDKNSIKERRCFLCKENRELRQLYLDILPGWELLVNPFPILPYHFTIAGKTHTRQKLYIEEGKKLADALPGMVVFFNSEGAGASAPDHIHFQAVPLESLPLIKLLDSIPEGEYSKLCLPYAIINNPSMLTDTHTLANAYFWKDREGRSRFGAIKRKAHRPLAYFKDPPERIAVSPGAVDMAGLIVTPFEEDFHKISDKDILSIYKEVAL